MKRFISIILVLSIGCGESNHNSEEITSNNNTIINLDSLISKNAEHALFMNFWNGMGNDIYDSLLRREQLNGNLEGHLYKFVFENSTNLDLPLLELINDGGFLALSLELTPTFVDSSLKLLRLDIPYETPDFRNDRKFEIQLKSEEDRSLEEIKYLRNVDNEADKRALIETYCIDQLLKLYEEKYGKPQVESGEYNHVLKTKSTSHVWYNGNKIILVEFNKDKKGRKNLIGITYSDRVYRENKKNEGELRNDSIVSRSRQHI